MTGAAIRHRWLAPAESAQLDPAQKANGKVLVVGFGRVGQLVAEMLSVHKVPWIAVERSPNLVEDARREGKPVLFGDASRPEMLHHLDLESALAVVVTMDHPMEQKRSLRQ